MSQTVNKERQQKEIKKLFGEIYTRSNALIEKCLIGYFVFGLLISFKYDTYMIAGVVGVSILAAYWITKKLFPNGTANQYVASAGFALFMAQFIYQMHGLFEMHFFAFIGTTIMITYQNWKNIIPVAVIIAVHHFSFWYIQASGFEEIYFSQVSWNMEVFLYHVGLAVVIFAICMYWSWEFSRRTIRNTINLLIMEDMNETVMENMMFASALANGDTSATISPKDDDIMGNALLKLKDKISGVSA